MRTLTPALPALALLAVVGAPAPGRDLPGEAVTFQSHGSTLQGRFFRARAPGARPTVLLFHGFPGGPGDVLGVGAAVSRAGWNALLFNPRGFHGSQGTHTLENALEDTAAALAFLRASQAPPGIDTGRIAVVGYSYGGWLALMAGMRHAEVKCVAAIAPGNEGMQARMLDGDPAYAASLRQTIERADRENLVRGLGWDSAAAEMRAHADEYDLIRHAAALAGRPVLVVGGWRDQGPTLEAFIVPLVRALRAAGNARVTPVALDDDHSYGATRQELHRVVVSWIESACAR